MITYMPTHLLSITIPYRYFYFFGYSICCRNSSLRIVKIFNSLYYTNDSKNLLLLERSQQNSY